MALFLLACVFAPAVAQDDPDAAKRLELMRAAVAALEPSSTEIKSKEALAAVATPLLRYSDPTRGGVKADDSTEVPDNVLLDAGVWRLGAAGRPAALVTVEIYQARDKSRVLSYEFLSLTDKAFTLKHKSEDVRWDATGTALEMKDLPDAPRPAATAAERLTQMRQLARRFAAKETYNNETVECRLIAQPLDRYRAEADGLADGAVFALANGTNPEIGVVLEVQGGRWRYGVVRLSSAESVVTLDGKQVVAFERFNAKGRRDGPYNSGSYTLGPGK
jgi:hypothetical protein